MKIFIVLVSGIDNGYDAFGSNLIPLDSTIIKISRTSERGFSGREPRVNGGVFAGII